jgi:hypothetical protein
MPAVRWCDGVGERRRDHGLRSDCDSIQRSHASQCDLTARFHEGIDMRPLRLSLGCDAGEIVGSADADVSGWEATPTSWAQLCCLHPTPAGMSRARLSRSAAEPTLGGPSALAYDDLAPFLSIFAHLAC